jgi:fatty acid synthase subunit alpha
VGKEAVFKSLGVKFEGSCSTDEIINDESGMPTVRLHGDARGKADEKRITNVLISL